MTKNEYKTINSLPFFQAKKGFVFLVISLNICLSGCGKGNDLVITSSGNPTVTEGNTQKDDDGANTSQEGGYSSSGNAAQEGGGSSADNVAESTNRSSGGEELYYVHVCGAVVNPGVYGLGAGKRYIDAVEAAGGMTDEAADYAVNLAALISDGERIYIPSQEEASEGVYEYNSGEQAQGLVNINTADCDQLCTLPGIGLTKAKAIIAYREQNGAFRTKEDIMNVTGIGNSTYNNIELYITV